MRRSRRGLFLPYEYAEFTYQTSPGVLTAMERWLADHADRNAAAAPGTGRQVALAVGIGVFVSCALSWFVLTG